MIFIVDVMRVVKVRSKKAQAMFLPFVSLVGLGVLFWILFGGTAAEVRVVGEAQQGVFDSIYFKDSGFTFLHSSLDSGMRIGLFNFGLNGGVYNSDRDGVLPTWFNETLDLNCQVSEFRELEIDWESGYGRFLVDAFSIYERGDIENKNRVDEENIRIFKNITVQEFDVTGFVEVNGVFDFLLNLDKGLHRITYEANDEPFMEVLEYPLSEDFESVRGLVGEKFVSTVVSEDGVDFAGSGLEGNIRGSSEGFCVPVSNSGCDTDERLLFLDGGGLSCSSDGDCGSGFCHLGFCVDVSQDFLRGVKRYDVKTYSGVFHENSGVEDFENLRYSFGLEWVNVSEDFYCVPGVPPESCERSGTNVELEEFLQFLPARYSSSDYFCGNNEFLLESPESCEDRNLESRSEWDSCVEEIELYCSRLPDQEYSNCFGEFRGVVPCEYRDMEDSNWNECRAEVVAYCNDQLEDLRIDRTLHSAAVQSCIDRYYDDPDASAPVEESGDDEEEETSEETNNDCREFFGLGSCEGFCFICW